MKAVKYYIKEGQLAKDDSYRNLAAKFLEKARHKREIAQYSITKADNKRDC